MYQPFYWRLLYEACSITARKVVFSSVVRAECEIKLNELLRSKQVGLSSLLPPLNMKLLGWPHQVAPAGLAKRRHYLIIWISKPSNGITIWDTRWSSAFIIAGCKALFQCSMSWPVKKKRNASKYSRRQTERNTKLCKLIERKPGKVNEIPLKLNDTPGGQG